MSRQPRHSRFPAGLWLVLAVLGSLVGCASRPPAGASHSTLHVAPVTGVSRAHATRLVRVSAGNETLAVTPEHPFFVPGRGWIPAERLKLGDALDGAANDPAQVDLVAPLRTARVPVFNLLVSGTHSYRVGQGGVLVHNGSCSNGKHSDSSDDESSHHPSRRDLERHGVTPEEIRALREWSFQSHNFRNLGFAISEHPDLRTLPYGEANTRGWLSFLDLHESPPLTPEQRFDQLRHQLLVDIPSYVGKAPKYSGTVYRGLRLVPHEQIDAWREKMRTGEPIELGVGGRSGPASATDRLILAHRFTRRPPQPNRVAVVLVIEQRSGVSIRSLSLARSENEILIPAGTRFRITSVEGSPPGTITIHLVEL